MKRLGLILALSGSAGLAGCSALLDATFFNNTGEEIAVDWEGARTTITASQFSQFHYIDGDRNRKVRLSSGGCAYLYEVPPELKDYRPDRKLDRGLQIQVEKDFSIVLLSPSYAGDMPASGDIVLQHEGFPLRPMTKVCGAEAAR